MKRMLLSLLLALAVHGAWAQSLPYGMTVANLHATRDTATGVSTITGTIANQGTRLAGKVSVTFVLYDAQGKEVGTASDSTTGLAPGEIWHVQVQTPLQFSHFSARDVQAE